MADARFWGGVYGALLLPVRGGAGEFYRRRVGRVLYPFLVWSAVCCLFPWLVSLPGGGRVVLAFFPYAGGDFLDVPPAAGIRGIAVSR